MTLLGVGQASRITTIAIRIAGCPAYRPPEVRISALTSGHRARHLSIIPRTLRMDAAHRYVNLSSPSISLDSRFNQRRVASVTPAI